MSIDTRVIRAEPHIQIGAMIEENAVTLLDRWCHRAISEQPNAKRTHHEVLRNQLLGFLQAMGRSLRQAGNPHPAYNQLASEHGNQRWDNGWSLAEVVRDYQLLQLVILEFLEQTLGRALRYREFMAVGVFIDDAVAASIAAYVANRETELRRAEQNRTDSLREANRRKDEFIAMLAHELRNPLAPIHNSAKILQLVLANSEPLVLQSLEVIDRQTKQLVRLVEDLLDLTRITQGKLELRRQPINLTTVLQEAVQMAEPMIKAREHRLTLHFPTEPVFLDADPERLIQVVVNLLHNAAKYTEKQGEISLSYRRDGDSAQIHVRDSGTGIPSEMLSQIFTLFTQLDSTESLRDGGLGIGLTLVRRLVELHGGSIAAHSDGVGKGSEFVVRLPAARAAAPRAERITAGGETRVPLSCRLLIIEDNEDARDALARLLRIFGHQVEIAENGLQGIKMASAMQPDVILIDIGLPDVNGYEVARQMRAQLCEHPFLIALTGFGHAEDLRRALDAGFDAHLTKPASLPELERLLVRAAARK